jgi:hypothetical protein
MVGTYDGAMVRLYVNGVQQFALAHTGALPTDTTGLLIGASVNDLAQTPVEALNGRVDQVRVYNVALTASEAQALYLGTSPPPMTADVAGATAYQIERHGNSCGYKC